MNSGKVLLASSTDAGEGEQCRHEHQCGALAGYYHRFSITLARRCWDKALTMSGGKELGGLRCSGLAGVVPSVHDADLHSTYSIPKWTSGRSPAVVTWTGEGHTRFRG
jgi:hypothetical protein